MKILKTIDTEKKNVWDFVTFLANIAAAAFITRLAVLETDTIYRTMFAIIASVLIVNILAKLYGLIRNQ